MPKVLRIINRFNLGGPTYNVSYLAKYLPEEYETLLIGGPEEEGEASSLFIPHSLGLKPLILKKLNREINLFNDYKAYKEIKNIILDFKPDIVHTHASKAGAVGRLAAISCKVPVIVHTFHGHVFHSYFGKAKTLFYKIIERYLAKRSNAIVAISTKQKQELTEEFKICDAQKTHVIPLGFDLKRFQENTNEKRNLFRNKHNINNETIAIGIIGRLAPIKNHELFINAIYSLANQTQLSFKAFIIGEGETRKQLENYILQKEEINAVAFKNYFVFTGWIEQVDAVLPGLDIVCLTSKNEGTPVSLIEAQASGKFIVSTNVGGIKDIVHPNCGFIANDAIEFNAFLLEAVNNLSEINIKAQQGPLFANQKFSYQRLVKDMDTLYKQLLFKKGT